MINISYTISSSKLATNAHQTAFKSGGIHDSDNYAIQQADEWG